MDFEILSTSKPFKGIASDDIAKLIDFLGYKEKQYKKNDIIFTTGTDTPQLGVVLSGSINAVVNHPWGESSIFGRMEAGDIFGGAFDIEKESRLLCDIVAAEDSEAVLFDMEAILNLRKDSPDCHSVVIRNLLKNGSDMCVALAKRMLHTSPKSIRHRLMSYLAEQAMMNDSNKFKIPFNRQQLADYLNVNRPAMSNELSKMQEDGLLKFHKFDFEIFFGNR